MSGSPIPGGYILVSRRLLDSDVWDKPPLYLKIWVYLLSRAQHQDYKGLKRGQLWTSIPEIQDAMAYRVGFRIEKPTKKQVWSALEWLRTPTKNVDIRFPCEQTVNTTTVEPMIETTKGTHGLLVTIINYDFYQDPKNYEGNGGGTNDGTMKGTRRERQGNNINKNVKNDKNDKKDLYGEFVRLTKDEHEKLTERLGVTLTNDYIERLNNYIGSSGRKYKSHYHTILTWIRKDEEKRPQEPKLTLDIYIPEDD